MRQRRHQPEVAIRSRLRRRFGVDALRAVGAAAARRFGRTRHVIIDVEIVGLARMRTLNRRWRGVDRPTDVLSLETALPPVGPLLLGPVFLCPDRAAQATDAKERSLPYLLAHGLLHCFGWEHESNAAAARMDIAAMNLLRAARVSVE